MATYYRWTQSSILDTVVSSVIAPDAYGSVSPPGWPMSPYRSYPMEFAESYTTSNGRIVLTNPKDVAGSDDEWRSDGPGCFSIDNSIGNGADYPKLYVDKITQYKSQDTVSNTSSITFRPKQQGTTYSLLTVTRSKGAFVQYVYSLDPGAYPENGISGSYWYDGRTAITSPADPTGLTYPSPITTPAVTVSWNPAGSNVPPYPVSGYEVGVSTDGGLSWAVAGNPAGNSLAYTVPLGVTSLMFRVRAKDAAGQWSGYATGAAAAVTIPPSTPASITASATVIEGQSVAVSWPAATRADGYILQRNTGTGWVQVYAGANTSFSETAGHGGSLQYRVQATNSYGSSGWATSNAVTVRLSPALTVPQLIMQGQSVPVSWSASSGADSYTLQRKADTDADWVQVYAGANTSFSETAGTWTSVQYRVQAVFGGAGSSWTTSAGIPVISQSALVISGSDGDLGTVVNDIPYTISSDTGNPITATVRVNSAVIFSGTVTSGAAGSIPVLDLVNGTGTIVIEASVTSNGTPVSAARTWTYTKALITFPGAGAVAQLLQQGETIWPKTLAECVRLPGGATLDKVMGFPAQVYAGSYTGTGTSGADNPNTLSFPFAPQMVFVIGWATGTTLPMLRPAQCAMNGSTVLTVSWSERGVSWYAADAATQINQAGAAYYYLAIG